MNLIVTILEQGLIYGILSLGLYITYKILDFPDLTVDGSFPLGAAVTAALITRGVNPYLTLPLAFAAGVLAGICTGLIHVKCKVRDLLSGIIMMTALWTINLYIAGTANVPLFSQQSIFKNDFINGLPAGIKPYMTLIIILILTAICKIRLSVKSSGRQSCTCNFSCKRSGKCKDSRTCYFKRTCISGRMCICPGGACV